MIPYHAQQTNYTCGTASMRMILEYFGIKKTEKQLARILHT
ncbi:C39 family peptidase, partial [Candidatus Woesearchaeota archaeon]|nr:C39 family peptidase [Candidatus Woesearchaeota archaeon]